MPPHPHSFAPVCRITYLRRMERREIRFVNAGGDEPCVLRYIYKDINEAANEFATLVEQFGTDNLKVKLTESEGLLEMKIRSEKADAVMPHAIYNENDFFIFTQVPRNKTFFLLMFGVMNSTSFQAMSHKGHAFVYVRHLDLGPKS